MLKLSAFLISGTIGLATVALTMTLIASHQQSISKVEAPFLSDEGTWITYTVNDGLPSNTVWGGVAVDKQGRVWAGFENGDGDYPLPTNTLISRFEGTSWINYQLPGCRVWPLVADIQVYAGTYCPGPPSNAGGGLSWFNNAGWVNFMPLDGMYGTYIRAIAPESSQRVWVAAAYDYINYPRVSMLDHKGTATKADDEWTVYNFGQRGVYAIAIDANGKHWFGTNNGLLVLSADRSMWITYTNELISNTLISDIAFDNVGNVWLATGVRVVRFDGHTWTRYNSREDAVAANYQSIIASYKRDRVNPVASLGLWVIEPDAGVWIIRFDSSGSTAGVGFYDGKSWTIYTTQNSGLGSDSYIRGIAVDHQGNVWIGTRDSYPDGPGGVDEFIPTPNFSVSVTSSVFMLEPDETATPDILVSHLRGWVPTATLSITGVPTATSIILSSNPLTPTAYSALSITTTMDTVFGIYPITITATGAAMTRTTMLTLLVVPKVYRYYWPIILQTSGGVP
jgi:hypothetical protein